MVGRRLLFPMSLVRSCLLPLLLLIATFARGDSLALMQPLPLPGPFAVGCSNVQQDFSRVPAGDDVQTFWQGNPRNGRARYITDLLVDPAHTLQLDVGVPNDGALYGDYAGTHVPYVLIVCYPTSAGNTRANYALPNGHAVPHMQTGAESPVFADSSVRYPVLMFSVGLGGSPLSDQTMDAIAVFASYGYVVVAPFHADARIADVRITDLTDLFFAAIDFKSFIAMQALRPLTLKLALDSILTLPDYAAHVDVARVGAFGGSLGGESALLMAGARLTTTIGQSSQTVLTDSRIRAIVGYVPYFGQDFYPAFGRNQDGLAGITVPFLGISGTADTTAPISMAEAGVRRLAGSRILVALKDVPHGFDIASTNDIFTWSLLFLAAHVQDDKLARVRIARMQSVAGGGDDSTVIDYTAPSSPAAGEVIVSEYHRDANDHYFITADAAEAAMLDAGTLVRGWTRTGFAFKAWPAGSPFGLATCRFFGTPGIGPDSHFYTNSASECATVRANPAWTYENIAFNAFPAIAGDCPADRVPVTRVYNNGRGGQANHRYVTSRSEAAATVARGWIIEGPVFCALP